MCCEIVTVRTADIVTLQHTWCCEIVTVRTADIVTLQHTVCCEIVTVRTADIGKPIAYSVFQILPVVKLLPVRAPNVGNPTFDALTLCRITSQ